jgi:hypothetical protein
VLAGGVGLYDAPALVLLHPCSFVAFHLCLRVLLPSLSPPLAGLAAATVSCTLLGHLGPESHSLSLALHHACNRGTEADHQKPPEHDMVDEPMSDQDSLARNTDYIAERAGKWQHQVARRTHDFTRCAARRLRAWLIRHTAGEMRSLNISAAIES